VVFSGNYSGKTIKSFSKTVSKNGKQIKAKERVSKYRTSELICIYYIDIKIPT
jgi:hypothetical protein